MKDKGIEYIERTIRACADQASVDRRSILKGGAAIAGATALTGGAAHATGGSGTVDEKRFLLDRITFGRNKALSDKYDEFALTSADPYTDFLEWQLDVDDADHDDGDAQIKADYPDIYKLWFKPDPGGGPDDVPIKSWDIFWDDEYYNDPCATPPDPIGPKENAIQGSSVANVMLRSHLSTRQLQYMMADFWQNHMLTTFLGQPAQYLTWSPSFHQSLLPNALGSYSQLLTASAKSGSMLWYLNLHKNTKQEPDENYARELLELHTTGKDNYLPLFGLPSPTPFVYTQNDVIETAKLLTGWTIQLNPGSGDLCSQVFTPNETFGEFTFNYNKHDESLTKTIMGVDYDDPLTAAGSLALGERFLEDLCPNRIASKNVYPHAAHTSLHVTARMIRWFIGDDLTGQFNNLWLRTAFAFYQSGGNIKATLRELFRVDCLDELRPAPYLKMRRPMNLVMGLTRAVEPDFTNLSPWILKLFQMGQAPGYRAAPNGYPSENKDWQGSLLDRQRFARDAITSPTDSGLDLTTARLNTIFAGVSSNYVDHVNQTLLGGILPASEVAALEVYVNQAPDDDAARREALVMAFSSPSYQYLY